MSPNQLIIFIFAVLSLILAVFGEIVSVHKCGDVTTKCDVHQVRVNPCKEAEQEKPCRLKKGKHANIAVDFTPGFSSDSLYSRAYWETELLDMPLLNMETDGCTALTCPIVEGTQYAYSYDLLLSKAFPSGTYMVKWKLMGENSDEDLCCFKFKILLK